MNFDINLTITITVSASALIGGVWYLATRSAAKRNPNRSDRHVGDTLSLPGGPLSPGYGDPLSQ
jgi:hypothetical protein